MTERFGHYSNSTYYVKGRRGGSISDPSFFLRDSFGISQKLPLNSNRQVRDYFDYLYRGFRSSHQCKSEQASKLSCRPNYRDIPEIHFTVELARRQQPTA